LKKVSEIVFWKYSLERSKIDRTEFDEKMKYIISASFARKFRENNKNPESFDIKDE
jgi:hypothetical protein